MTARPTPILVAISGYQSDTDRWRAIGPTRRSRIAAWRSLTPEPLGADGSATRGADTALHCRAATASGASLNIASAGMLNANCASLARRL